LLRVIKGSSVVVKQSGQVLYKHESVCSAKQNLENTHAVDRRGREYGSRNGKIADYSVMERKLFEELDVLRIALHHDEIREAEDKENR
jgi:hypothetical protein